MTMPGKIARYLALADQVFQIANSNASAETKYDLIFSDDLSRTLRQMFPLEYYDPDTSYEEDVTAFVRALREKCDDLRHIALNDDDFHDSRALARQVASETTPTDGVGLIARRLPWTVIVQEDELRQLRGKTGR